MEIRLLKAFVAVAQCKNFSKAAESLNYAQSSISEQIKRLENNLNVTLFERFGNQVRLTAQGKALLVYAEQILNLCDQAQEHLARITKTTVKGDLRLTVSETLCTYRLPKLLRNYHRHYPEVDLKIKIGNCDESPHWIRNNLTDLAFVLDNAQYGEDIISEELYQEPLVLVASGKHYFSEQTTTLQFLRQETLILTQKGSKYRDILEKHLKQVQIEPKALLEFESIAAIKNFVRYDLGIAFLPYSAVRAEILKGEIREIKLKDMQFSIPARLIYHINKWKSPAFLAMLELIRRSRW